MHTAHFSEHYKKEEGQESLKHVALLLFFFSILAPKLKKYTSGAILTISISLWA